eukprot:TRINITY_DN8963_c0_g1_i1.p1 TRINITY_DN8963_c0_g1~~TRINITY_DN8963_c0_g1_i1.p1  ORF type:complete len:640 (-),score=117.29 TRINITY_DN8963_c0_g1_i1:32-1738(-)
MEEADIFDLQEKSRQEEIRYLNKSFGYTNNNVDIVQDTQDVLLQRYKDLKYNSASSAPKSFDIQGFENDDPTQTIYSSNRTEQLREKFSSTKRKGRILPGPIGNITAQTQNNSPIILSPSKVKQKMVNFRTVPWFTLLYELNLPPYRTREQCTSGQLLEYNIKNILNTSAKHLKVTKLAAIIVELLKQDDGSVKVHLQDPTGEIVCSVKNLVLENYKNFVCGSAILVSNVPVIRKHLIITLKAIEKIYSSKLKKFPHGTENIDENFDLKEIYSIIPSRRNYYIENDKKETRPIVQKTLNFNHDRDVFKFPEVEKSRTPIKARGRLSGTPRGRGRGRGRGRRALTRPKMVPKKIRDRDEAIISARNRIVDDPVPAPNNEVILKPKPSVQYNPPAPKPNYFNTVQIVKKSNANNPELHSSGSTDTQDVNMESLSTLSSYSEQSYNEPSLSTIVIPDIPPEISSGEYMQHPDTTNNISMDSPHNRSEQGTVPIQSAIPERFRKKAAKVLPPRNDIIQKKSNYVAKNLLPQVLDGEKASFSSGLSSNSFNIDNKISSFTTRKRGVINYGNRR